MTVTVNKDVKKRRAQVFLPHFLLFVGVFGLFLLYSWNYAAAEEAGNQNQSSVAVGSQDELFEPRLLKGIDTIIVTEFYGLRAEHFRPKYNGVKFTPDNFRQLSPNPSFAAVKEIFSQIPWITVKPFIPGDKNLHAPNVAIMNVNISTQDAMLGNKNFATGAVTVQLKKGAWDNQVIVPIPAIPYPFIVPETSSEFDNAVTQGINKLVQFLPSYFVCGNKHGEASPECPDCNLNSCDLLNPPY